MKIDTTADEVIISVFNESHYPVIAHGEQCYFYQDLLEKYDEKESSFRKKEILKYVSIEIFEVSRKRKNQIICIIYIKLNINIPIEIYEYPQSFSPYPYIFRRYNIKQYSELISIWMNEKQKLIHEINIDLENEYILKSNYKGYFNSQDIEMYPNSLGKGMKRCIQLAKYYDAKKYDPSFDDTMSEKIIMEILQETAQDINAVNDCINSEHCGGLYKRLQDGTLDQIPEEMDVLKIAGKIYPYINGNHRLCLLKRSKVSVDVLANIYEYEKK